MLRNIVAWGGFNSFVHISSHGARHRHLGRLGRVPCADSVREQQNARRTERIRMAGIVLSNRRGAPRVRRLVLLA
jgi:hypothetical protein